MTPTLDYLTEARRRGAIQRNWIGDCRCEVCTASSAAVRANRQTASYEPVGSEAGR